MCWQSPQGANSTPLSPIHGGPTLQLTGLKRSAANISQMHQHTFSSLVESMPQLVRAVLAEKKGDQNNIRQVVIMLRLISV